MITDPDKLKMAQAADETYQKKYAPLTTEYLIKPASYANLEDVINGKVTLAHADAITNYSGGLSAVVNGALRGQYLDLTVKVSAYDKVLTEALESLSPFNDQTVYRMELHVEDTVPYEAYFNRYLKKVLTIPCYMSTSKEDWYWEKLIYRIRTLKENSHARDISRITNKADEAEVLFLNNTNFMINSVIRTEDRLIIDMEETKQENAEVLNYYNNPDDLASDGEDQELGMFD